MLFICCLCQLIFFGCLGGETNDHVETNSSQSESHSQQEEMQEESREFVKNSRGQVNQVVIRNKVAYCSRAEKGFSVINIENNRRVIDVPSLAPMFRVDAIAVDGDILFAFDVTAGVLSSFSIEVPELPMLIDEMKGLERIADFSNISAQKGYLVISGGGTQFSVIRYTEEGVFSSQEYKNKVARRQPHVLVSQTGKEAYLACDKGEGGYGWATISLDGQGELLSEYPLEGVLEQYAVLQSNFPICFAENETFLFVATGRKVMTYQKQGAGLFSKGEEIDLPFDVTGCVLSGDEMFCVGYDPQPTLWRFSLNQRGRKFMRYPLADRATPCDVAVNDQYVVVATRQQDPAIIKKDSII